MKIELTQQQLEWKATFKHFVETEIEPYAAYNDQQQFIHPHVLDKIRASGFVNSLFAMQLILFLEKEFKIRIENEDMDIDNFRSLNKINALIEQKTMG